MASPTSLSSLKEYVLRALGSPVIEINIAEEQLNDRIDDALKFWQKYHHEAYRKEFVVHKITAADKTNRWIPLDPKIIAVEGMFKIGGYPGYSSDDIFNPVYQLRLHDLWDLSQANITGYVIARQYIALLDDQLNHFPQFRYQHHEGKLFLDTDWTLITEGQFICVDCYMLLDPATNPKIYGDEDLRELAVAYAKKQWGTNLSKFQNIQLPGGIMMNGAAILKEANDEIKTLEADFIDKHQKIIQFFVG